jgi:catechol 2,3-dioxygenase-like lactoylglutathione lyase family enzyme
MTVSSKRPAAKPRYKSVMEILFVSSFAPVVPDPKAGRAFYQDTLGLPLEVVAGDYVAVEGFGGTKHLGVWPLADAAEACFGTREWPADVPVPQASLEFEVADVAAAAAELETAGHTLIHGARTEPWGQQVARLFGPEGLIVGVCYTPWMHEGEGEAGPA